MPLSFTRLLQPLAKKIRERSKPEPSSRPRDGLFRWEEGILHSRAHGPIPVSAFITGVTFQLQVRQELKRGSSCGNSPVGRWWSSLSHWG